MKNNPKSTIINVINITVIKLYEKKVSISAMLFILN